MVIIAQICATITTLAPALPLPVLGYRQQAPTSSLYSMPPSLCKLGGGGSLWESNWFASSIRDCHLDHVLGGPMFVDIG